jgi:hypothetical protein
MQLDESENADRHDEDDGESFAALRLLFLAACFYVSIMVPTAVYSYHTRIVEQDKNVVDTLVHLPCSIKDWHGITFAVAIVIEPILNGTFECRMIHLTNFLCFFKLICRSTLRWQN